MSHRIREANRADVSEEPALLQLKSSFAATPNHLPYGGSCFDGVQLLHIHKCPLEHHSTRKPSQPPPPPPVGLMCPWHF